MKAIAIAVLLLLLSIPSHSQTLNDFLQAARRQSTTVMLAKKEQELAHVRFGGFRLSGKPSVELTGNIPGYNRDNTAVTQPDGTILFVPRSQTYGNAGVGFVQPLLFSGGNISVNTELYRFDNLRTHTTRYNGTPVFLRLSQSLFNYNSYKWEKQIEPLRLQEATATYRLAELQLDADICRLYFEVVSAQQDTWLATNNLGYITTNLDNEKRKLQLGTTTEDKTLQLEMQLIRSRQQLLESGLQSRQMYRELCTLAGNPDTSLRILQLPENIPASLPDAATSVERARKNLPAFIAFDRKRKEAAAKKEEAQRQGRQVDLTASYGLNNSSETIGAIYKNPQDQQRFSIGLRIPILDGGRRRNAVAQSKILEEQVLLQQKSETDKILLRIAVLSEDLLTLKNNISQSLQLDTIAQKRFLISNRLFQSGKLSLLEWQSAQTEKDNAHRGYVLALQRFWETWYAFRVATNTPEN